MLLACLLVTASIPGFFAHGEEPIVESTYWVQGLVTYPDGSKCRNCCHIRVETDYGFSEATCSDIDAGFRIDVGSEKARALYFRGDLVWTGDVKTRGGVTINVTAG